MSHNSKLMYRNRVVNHHRNHSNNCSKPRIISIVNWMDFWIWKHHWLGMYYFHNTYLNSFSLVLHRVSQMMTDEWGEKNQHMWHMFVRAFISHARNLEWRVAKYSIRFFPLSTFDPKRIQYPFECWKIVDRGNLLQAVLETLCKTKTIDMWTPSTHIYVIHSLTRLPLPIVRQLTQEMYVRAFARALPPNSLSHTHMSKRSNE